MTLFSQRSTSSSNGDLSILVFAWSLVADASPIPVNVSDRHGFACFNQRFLHCVVRPFSVNPSLVAPYTLHFRPVLTFRLATFDTMLFEKDIGPVVDHVGIAGLGPLHATKLFQLA